MLPKSPLAPDIPGASGHFGSPVAPREWSGEGSAEWLRCWLTACSVARVLSMRSLPFPAARSGLCTGAMAVRRVSQLNALGQSRKERGRLARAGELVRVRHGAYADEAAVGALQRHLQLVAGTEPLLAPGTVLSHVSAGILHQLPSWEPQLGRVTVIRQSAGHGSRRTALHSRSLPLSAEEVTSVGGHRCTTLERTAIDLACSLDFERAVAVLDAALRLGGSRTVMSDIVSRSSGRHGVGTARAALSFADGKSESVGESVSRVRLAEAGVAVPGLQLNVFDASGQWVARCDFGWALEGVLGEFDGRIKYIGTPGGGGPSRDAREGPRGQTARTRMGGRALELGRPSGRRTTQAQSRGGLRPRPPRQDPGTRRARRPTVRSRRVTWLPEGPFAAGISGASGRFGSEPAGSERAKTL